MILFSRKVIISMLINLPQLFIKLGTEQTFVLIIEHQRYACLAILASSCPFCYLNFQWFQLNKEVQQAHEDKRLVCFLRFTTSWARKSINLNRWVLFFVWLFLHIAQLLQKGLACSFQIFLLLTGLCGINTDLEHLCLKLICINNTSHTFLLWNEQTKNEPGIVKLYEKPQKKQYSRDRQLPVLWATNKWFSIQYELGWSTGARLFRDTKGSRWKQGICFLYFEHLQKINSLRPCIKRDIISRHVLSNWASSQCSEKIANSWGAQCLEFLHRRIQWSQLVYWGRFCSLCRQNFKERVVYYQQQAEQGNIAWCNQWNRISGAWKNSE